MNLPDTQSLRVEQRKITEYLLCPSHMQGCGKAEFFQRFGFRADHWQVLAQALRVHGQAHPVVKVVESAHGVRYTVDGVLDCPDGRKPRVRTIWIADPKGAPPRLVTAHPV